MRSLLHSMLLLAFLAPVAGAQEDKEEVVIVPLHTPAKAKANHDRQLVVEVELFVAEWNIAGEDQTQAFPKSNADLIKEVQALEKAGKLNVAKHLRITAVENVKTSLQIGQRRPRVVATNSFGGRGAQSSVAYENMGTMLVITPAVHNDSLSLELTYEHSEPQMRDDSPVIGEGGDGAKIRAESMGTLQLSTLVRLKSGETVVVGGASENNTRQVVLVTAKLLP